MKKVLLAFAVASIFAACDDSSKTETTTTDSTGVKADSAAITAPVDTTVVDTTANKMSADTTKK